MGDLMDMVTTKEALSPFGQVVLTAYGLWHRDAAPDVPFPLGLWPKATTFRRSDLQGPGWAVAVWDIDPARWPVEPWTAVLAGTLQALRDAGAAIAWFALEGGFADPPALFEADQTGDAVYAVLADGLGPLVTASPQGAYRGIPVDVLDELKARVVPVPAVR
jgi:hypothetical protein